MCSIKNFSLDSPYQQIFQLPLVAEFVPGKTLQGPHIRIYSVYEPGRDDMQDR